MFAEIDLLTFDVYLPISKHKRTQIICHVDIKKDLARWVIRKAKRSIVVDACQLKDCMARTLGDF